MTHRHICACGDYYVCSANHDTCPKGWTCPTCEQEQLDDYWRTNPHQAPLELNAAHDSIPTLVTKEPKS